MAEKTYLKLLEVIDGLEKEGVKKVAIEMQRTPDPDSIACALLLKYVLNKRGSYKVDITHANHVDDPRNKLMLTELNLGAELVRYKNDKGDERSPDYDAFFFVDHSGGTSEWYKEGKIPVEKLRGVIDHHDLETKLPDNIPFVDRRRVGACSTIMASYLIEGIGSDINIDLEKSKNFERIATALLLGIRSDTKLLTSNDVTQLDHDAAEFLKKYVSLEVIHKIENPKLDKELIDIIARASLNRIVKNEIMICFAGHITHDQHTVLTRAAEWLLTQKGILTVYAVGIQPQYIDVSIRTEDPEYDFEKLRELFPECSGCGGRKGAGGLQIPNPLRDSFLNRNDDERKSAVEQMVLDEFKKRLFK